MLPKASKSNEFNERKFFRSRQQYPLMSAIVAHDTTKTEVKRIIRYFFYSLFICSEKSPERNGKSERKTIEVLSKMWSEQKAYVVSGERARACALCSSSFAIFQNWQKHITLSGDLQIFRHVTTSFIYWNGCLRPCFSVSCCAAYVQLKCSI